MQPMVREVHSLPNNLGSVTLVQYMGSDISVVNAARVSFSKKSEWLCSAHDDKASASSETGECYNCFLSERDSKLITYLAKNGHWTPFGHVMATLAVKCPIFVARQIMRSNVGIVYNETSRRYIDSEPEFCDLAYRTRADKAKQGSGGPVDLDTQMNAELISAAVEAEAVSAYEKLLEMGIAPEQARAVLPQSMLTEFWMTGSLAALARVYLLRSGSHAQKESQMFAEALRKAVRGIASHSWDALISHCDSAS